MEFQVVKSNKFVRPAIWPSLDDIRREAVKCALMNNSGNYETTAKSLGISKKALLTLISRLVGNLKS